MGEGTVFTTNAAGTIRYPHAHNAIPHIKRNSKQIKDQLVRTKSIELLGENIRANLHDLGFDNGLLVMTQNVQAIKIKG